MDDITTNLEECYHFEPKYKEHSMINMKISWSYISAQNGCMFPRCTYFAHAALECLVYPTPKTTPRLSARYLRTHSSWCLLHARADVAVCTTNTRKQRNRQQPRKRKKMKMKNDKKHQHLPSMTVETQDFSMRTKHPFPTGVPAEHKGRYWTTLCCSTGSRAVFQEEG